MLVLEKPFDSVYPSLFGMLPSPLFFVTMLPPNDASHNSSSIYLTMLSNLQEIIKGFDDGRHTPSLYHNTNS